MPLSFASNGAARFSAVVSIDWDNITGAPDIIEFPAVSTEHAIARYADAGGNIENSEVLVDDNGNITPSASDAGALGTSAVPWSDAFLASGGVINFAASNYTLTHTPGTVSASGAFSVGGNLSVTGTFGLTSAATFASYADFGEIAAPSSPSANLARFYAKDNGSGTTKLYYKNSAGTEQELGGRVTLTAETSYNVGAAQTYTTPQALYEFAQASIDTAGFDVVCQLTDSSLTTTSTFDGPLTGGGRFIIRGDTTTPNNRILTCSTASFTLQPIGADILLEGVGFTHTGGAGSSIFARHGATVTINANCQFGGGAGTHDIALQNGSRLIRAASYRISGTRARHISISSNSNVSTTAAITTTMVSTPVWSDAFAWGHASGRICFRADESFSGSSTGPRFLLEEGGHIFTDGSGLSFLPGDAAGTLDATSSYDGIFGPAVHSNNVTYALPAGPTGTMGQFANADATNTIVLADAFAAATVFGGRRAQGTAASPTALSAADQAIVVFGAYGRDNSGYSTSAQADMSMFTSEDWTTTERGTHIRVRTTPIGSTTLTEVARFNNAEGLVLASPLRVASGGIGVAAAACYLGASANLDMNVTTDQALTVALPTGYTRYKILQILVYEPSISLTTAAGGIYTSASKAGVQIVASSQAYSGLTATGPDVLASALVLAATNSNTIFLADTTLFFSLTTPQGAAATAKIAVYIMPVP